MPPSPAAGRPLDSAARAQGWVLGLSQGCCLWFDVQIKTKPGVPDSVLWSSFDPGLLALYEAVLGVGLVGCGLQPDEIGIRSEGARSSPCELAG